MFAPKDVFDSCIMGRNSECPFVHLSICLSPLALWQTPRPPQAGPQTSMTGAQIDKIPSEPIRVETKSEIYKIFIEPICVKTDSEIDKISIEPISIEKNCLKSPGYQSDQS